MLLTRESAEADVESIGERIIETPLSVRDTDFLRNPRSGFIAYVPQGSLIEGDPEFSRDDTIATAGERAHQCLLRYTHAVGFSGVEASDAGVNCRVHGALKLYFVYMTVGAADLPAAGRLPKPSGRSVRIAGIPSEPPYCAAIAGARAAKRCSISRRAATGSLSGIVTSAEHTIMPAAM